MCTSGRLTNEGRRRRRRPGINGYGVIIYSSPPCKIRTSGGIGRNIRFPRGNILSSGT